MIKAMLGFSQGILIGLVMILVALTIWFIFFD